MSKKKKPNLADPKQFRGDMTLVRLLLEEELSTLRPPVPPQTEEVPRLNFTPPEAVEAGVEVTVDAAPQLVFEPPKAEAAPVKVSVPPAPQVGLAPPAAAVVPLEIKVGVPPRLSSASAQTCISHPLSVTVPHVPSGAAFRQLSERVPKPRQGTCPDLPAPPSLLESVTNLIKGVTHE